MNLSGQSTTCTYSLSKQKSRALENARLVRKLATITIWGWVVGLLWVSAVAWHSHFHKTLLSLFCGNLPLFYMGLGLVDNTVDNVVQQT